MDTTNSNDSTKSSVSTMRGSTEDGSNPVMNNEGNRGINSEVSHQSGTGTTGSSTTSTKSNKNNLASNDNTASTHHTLSRNNSQYKNTVNSTWESTASELMSPALPSPRQILSILLELQPGRTIRQVLLESMRQVKTYAINYRLQSYRLNRCRGIV